MCTSELTAFKDPKCGHVNFRLTRCDKIPGQARTTEQWAFEKSVGETKETKWMKHLTAKCAHYRVEEKKTRDGDCDQNFGPCDQRFDTAPILLKTVTHFDATRKKAKNVGLQEFVKGGLVYDFKDTES